MSIEPINLELCTGCGTCQDICPVDVIRMDTAQGIPVIKYRQDCMLCQLCVVECPANAITVTPGRLSPVSVSW
ncbi:4Fe-4S binding protein [Lentisphaerota bacterium ZTH]|nr:4Fe-4S binding protein [Lentisphaerota bacterium]WET07304.1 4Fe-4S binding protein [Lentisphaerota bacterium ZTH]